jgi:hypothetical protein
MTERELLCWRRFDGMKFCPIAILSVFSKAEGLEFKGNEVGDTVLVGGGFRAFKRGKGEFAGRDQGRGNFRVVAEIEVEEC